MSRALDLFGRPLSVSVGRALAGRRRGGRPAARDIPGVGSSTRFLRGTGYYCPLGRSDFTRAASPRVGSAVLCACVCACVLWVSVRVRGTRLLLLRQSWMHFTIKNMNIITHQSVEAIEREPRGPPSVVLQLHLLAKVNYAQRGAGGYGYGGLFLRPDSASLTNLRSSYILRLCTFRCVKFKRIRTCSSWEL